MVSPALQSEVSFESVVTIFTLMGFTERLTLRRGTLEERWLDDRNTWVAYCEANLRWEQLRGPRRTSPSLLSTACQPWGVVVTGFGVSLREGRRSPHSLTLRERNRVLGALGRQRWSIGLPSPPLAPPRA